jgi:hypothetical protein
LDLENFCNCRSDLENLGERRLVIRALLAEGIRELSKAGGIRGGGVTPFYRLTRRGGFSEGLGTPRRVNQGLDTSTSRQSGARHVKVGRLQVQGLDTSRRCHLTGARLSKSLPPTGVHALSAAICRQVFHNAGSARSYSVD